VTRVDGTQRTLLKTIRWGSRSQREAAARRYVREVQAREAMLESGELQPQSRVQHWLQTGKVTLDKRW
jgi:hypothetical protein